MLLKKVDKSFISTAQQAVLTDVLVPKSSTNVRPRYRPGTSLFSLFKNNYSWNSCSPSKPNTQPMEEIPVFSAASTTTQTSVNSNNLSSVTSAGNKHATNASLSSKVDDNTSKCIFG